MNLKNVEILIVIALFCIVITGFSCKLIAPCLRSEPFLSYSVEELAEAVIKPELERSKKIKHDYLDFYGFSVLPGTSVEWKRLNDTNESFVMTFTPKTPIRTVVVIHGYLDHSGADAYLVNFLLAKNYKVICADLPGHGLSGGERADIGEFSQYADFLSGLIDYCQMTDKKLDLIAHSTGGSAVLEYLRKHESPFGRVVLLAPLVRSYLWDLAQFGVETTKWFIDGFPAIRGASSRDKKFVKINRADPLRGKKVPYTWVAALKRWDDELDADTSVITTALLVIQGTNDTVIEKDFGKKYLERSFSNLEYKTIKGGLHGLHYDKLSIRSQVFHLIEEYFENGKPVL